MKRPKIFLAFMGLLSACPEPAERRRATFEPPLTELWLWQDQLTAAKVVVEPLAPQPVGGLVVTSGRVAFDDLKVATDRRREMALPRGALLHLGDQTMVFIEVGKAPDGRVRFERRPVSVSDELGGDYLPVIRGISAGERVVTVGAILLTGMF